MLKLILSISIFLLARQEYQAENILGFILMTFALSASLFWLVLDYVDEILNGLFR